MLLCFTHRFFSLMRGHSLAPNGIIWKGEDMFNNLFTLINLAVLLDLS